MEMPLIDIFLFYTIIFLEVELPIAPLQLLIVILLLLLEDYCNSSAKDLFRQFFEEKILSLSFGESLD